MSLRGYYGNRRCVDGRLMRHDPQHDDPDLETDIGECPDCGGKGCPAPEPATVSKPVMMCACGAVLENPAKYAEHCRDFPSHFTNT